MYRPAGTLVFRQLRGDITVGSLVISEGAVFSGVAEMTKPMEIKGKVAPDKQREN